MKCLRCGHCCRNYWVVIVDDPTIGIRENNLIALPGDGTPCKHLDGDGPGNYSCALHDLPWYEETPCFRHGQIENSSENECRIGRFLIDGLEAKRLSGEG